tara:strand:+ start:602 stop:730 length:129 start_codon:yes stop_codon:yes gene_type:complete
MISPEYIIIYLDIGAFVILIIFFVILFKSSGLFRDNKNNGGL